VLLSDDFLEDDGHFLLVDDVGGGGHVVLAGAVEYACVYALDGVAEHLQAAVLVVCEGNHVGAVDACEWLVMAVFEQRRGADGNWLAYDFKEGHQVVGQSLGEARVEEVAQDFVVGDVAQGHLVEFVCVHEFVEDVGAEDDGLRNHDACVGKLVEVGVPLDDVVDEGDAAPFSAEASVADPGEVGVLVEAVAVEDGDDALVLHAAVGDDGVEDDLAVGVDVLEGVPGDVSKELGDGEQGAAAEPAGYVVV